MGSNLCFWLEASAALRTAHTGFSPDVVLLHRVAIILSNYWSLGVGTYSSSCTWDWTMTSLHVASCSVVFTDVGCWLDLVISGVFSNLDDSVTSALTGNVTLHHSLFQLYQDGRRLQGCLSLHHIFISLFLSSFEIRKGTILMQATLLIFFHFVFSSQSHMDDLAVLKK